MRSKIQQWGNSLALRIPKPFAEEAGLSRHSDVELSVVDGNLLVFPITEPQPPILNELLDEVTDDNLHSETDTGPAVGREIW